MRILDASSDSEALGVSAIFRKPTPGLEYELLMAFLAEGLPSPHPNERVAVFIEPRLETGFPDAVAAYWRCGDDADVGVAEHIGPLDDRVLHLIWLEPGIEASSLQARFGRQIAARASELVSMGLVQQTGSGMRVGSDQLVLTRLIAIEAKMSGPSSALRQAARNTWFASESYVLMPAVPSTQTLSDRYSACGVGILTPDTGVDSAPLRAAALDLPQSHVTWRFNRMALELTAAGVA